MTSESYAREETWAPLPEGLRKWERSIVDTEPISSGTGRGHATTHWELPRGAVGSSDFASEASNEDIAAPIGGRPQAPRMNEAHVWGVREDWGVRAKKWGRGAKAYENIRRAGGESSDMVPRTRSPTDRLVDNDTDK